VPARIVWRITTARRARTAFSGEGARLYGGRCNPKGVPLVYTAESRALAMLEMLVQDEPLRARYVVIPATFPDGLAIERVDPAKLPPDWRLPQRTDDLRAMGAEWAASRRTAVLAAPSAVLPEETNYLLNVLHPDFRRIRVGKPRVLVTDVRLLKRRRPAPT
jgi:RES domain-containing protein